MSNSKPAVTVRISAQGSFLACVCGYKETIDAGPTTPPEVIERLMTRFCLKHDRVCPRGAGGLRSPKTLHKEVLLNGREPGIAIYSSCNDVTYAQAEVLLQAENAQKSPESKGQKMLGYYDEVDDLPVIQFLNSYSDKIPDLHRLNEIRALILQKGWRPAIEEVLGSGQQNEVKEPMMGFQDLLGHLNGLFERLLAEPAFRGVPIRPFKDTHVFYMGDEPKLLESLETIREDLVEEAAKEIPMPFPDTTVISKNPNTNVWIVSRWIENPPEISSQEVGQSGAASSQRLFMLDYLVTNSRKHWYPVGMTFWHSPTEMGRLASSRSAVLNTDERRIDTLAEEAVGAFAGSNITGLCSLVAISHPMNYLVLVTPRLTPREERKAKQGVPRPVEKTPHFIIVDHEVLCQLNPKKPMGTHASPIPHHRRGHWMRLAERCRHARLLGEEKVFVKPTYVGDRLFSDEKNHYEVILENRKQKGKDVP